MNIVDEDADATGSGDAEKDGAVVAENAMDVDTAKSATTSSKSSTKKGRIEKRRKTSKIVFPKYGDKAKKKRKN
ncbi:hypothetical protein NPX13_g3393 [Xylaria arbuscula]|uniref:Uncharacterized protein n=1 Tax=Xylaria arbuscula TaxID=114810 RepID=A0A9W8NHD8_9PEZI|nr:hypothetical protein NPX13_g3393 [Xylaria arbuscula]